MNECPKCGGKRRFSYCDPDTEPCLWGRGSCYGPRHERKRGEAFHVVCELCGYSSVEPVRKLAGRSGAGSARRAGRVRSYAVDDAQRVALCLAGEEPDHLGAVDQRDACGQLTLLALALDALEDHGCDCGVDEPGSCLACRCKAGLADLAAQRDRQAVEREHHRETLRRWWAEQRWQVSGCGSCSKKAYYLLGDREPWLLGPEYPA